MTFASPHWLWLLALLPLVAAGAWRAHTRQARLRYSDTSMLRSAPRTLRVRLLALLPALTLIALTLGIVAMARPQQRHSTEERFTEGIDILLALDTSTSMRAQDFQPNRFEAARAVAAEFIRSRTSDRVGIVVFAARAYTQAPLTLDYDFLLRMLDGVRIGSIEDGTAIGTALATASARLRHSTARSRVVILLTDGQNNRGEVDPLTAADIAASLGVRVYAIGVGGRQNAPFVSDDPYTGHQLRMVPVEIDEQMLSRIAQATGGRYFRADSPDALRNIYTEIARLEKSRIRQRVYTDVRELYALFLAPAFALVLLQTVLGATVLRRFP